MFGKVFARDICVSLFLLSYLAAFTYGAPVVLRQRQLDGSANSTNVEIVPLVAGTAIDPVLVDLLDRVKNLQQQVNQAQPGSAGYDALVKSLTDTKASLDQQLSGVATLTTIAATPTPSSTDASTTTQPAISVITETVSTTTLPAGSSSTLAASTTASASLSTTTLPPASTSINTDVPVVTVVTQVGTSIVVLASQGVTRTVTLATITGVQSATSTSIVAVSSSAAASSGASSPSAPVSGSSAPSSTASTSPVASGTSVSAQAAVVQGSNDSGALAISPMGSQVLTGMVVAAVLGALL